MCQLKYISRYTDLEILQKISVVIIYIIYPMDKSKKNNLCSFQDWQQENKYQWEKIHNQMVRILSNPKKEEQNKISNELKIQNNVGFHKLRCHSQQKSKRQEKIFQDQYINRNKIQVNQINRIKEDSPIIIKKNNFTIKRFSKVNSLTSFNQTTSNLQFKLQKKVRQNKPLIQLRIKPQKQNSKKLLIINKYNIELQGRQARIQSYWYDPKRAKQFLERKKSRQVIKFNFIREKLLRL